MSFRLCPDPGCSDQSGQSRCSGRTDFSQSTFGSCAMDCASSSSVGM